MTLEERVMFLERVLLAVIDMLEREANLHNEMLSFPIDGWNVPWNENDILEAAKRLREIISTH